jgi:hypothetical protein
MSGRLQIDFAPPQVRRALRRVPFLAWAAMALGLALAGAAALSWQQRAQRESGLQQELERIETRLRQTAQRAAERRDGQRAALPSVAAANAVIAQLNTPWAAMLDALERANGGSVALLELLPDLRRGRLRGLAEARNAAAMGAYIEALKAQPVFGAAWLRRHEMVDAEAGPALRFEFEIDWPEGAR